MAKSLPRYVEELAYRLPCPVCGAQPPHMCRSPATGIHTKRPHARRTALLHDAWRAGYLRGVRSARARKENA